MNSYERDLVVNTDAKEEVRARLDIEAVIGEYVTLRRAGRNWKGLSPFSDEKTPSFVVSPEKGIWHDFSSNQGGDVFSFVMQVEGMDFRGALEHLARKAGVDLSQFEEKTSSSGLSEKKKRMRAMQDTAATFYQRTLLANETAIAYIKKRGFNRQVVHDFRLGYAPADGNVLRDFLLTKGYSLAELREGGLVGSRGGDLFWDRLMIPLSDGQGQIIGFTARLLRDIKGAPKYLNTPQTLIYDKSRHVYGLHLAKEAIRKGGKAVIVEGNLDVISSHQVGVNQVVATAGTALTDHHLKALSRLSEHILLAFDGDKAGLAATERAIPIAQTVGIELSIVVLPGDAKDPDELIQQDVKLWETALETAQPAIDWVIDQHASHQDLDTAHGKRELTTKVLTLLAQLENRVEQEHYIKVLSKRVNVVVETLQTRMEQLAEDIATPRLKPVKDTPIITAVSVTPHTVQDHLLTLLIMDHELRDQAMELSVDAFDGEARQALFRSLATNPGSVSLDTVPTELHAFDDYVKMVQLKAETRYNELTAQERLTQASHLIEQIKQQHLKQKKLTLTNQLRDAESIGDEDTVRRLRHEFNDLIKEEHNRGKSQSRTG
ncbi:MAG: DNA primase [Candidatus Saccharimonadales bacterium]